MSQVIWQDELVMWVKDFTVAFSDGAYSVPFEHSMARRAIIEQGATPLEVAECWDEIVHAVNCDVARTGAARWAIRVGGGAERLVPSVEMAIREFEAAASLIDPFLRLGSSVGKGLLERRGVAVDA